MTNDLANPTSNHIDQKARALERDMEKASCKDTSTGMSPDSESAKRLVAFAANRLQREIFGWE